MTVIDPRFLKLNIVDNLTQGGANDPLSAEQGKNLHLRLKPFEDINGIDCGEISAHVTKSE